MCVFVLFLGFLCDDFLCDFLFVWGEEGGRLNYLRAHIHRRFMHAHHKPGFLTGIQIGLKKTHTHLYPRADTPSCLCMEGSKEGNLLFNDALNTFYLRLYGVRHMVKDHSDREKGKRCRHIGYSFQLAARVLLYASSHRRDNTYHGHCYTSRGALAGTRNSSMASVWKSKCNTACLDYPLQPPYMYVPW